MVKLLDDIAREKLIDEWSSREMLAILSGQTHNSLLPVPLPPDVKIAHKTGSLHDTLDDVGIVYHDEEPYVIAVMTTQLSDLEDGRRFIHRVSRIAYDQLTSFGEWRTQAGLPAFVFSAPADRLSPDQQMWRARSSSALDPDAEEGETLAPPITPPGRPSPQARPVRLSCRSPR